MSENGIDGFYGQLRYFLNQDVTLITRYDQMEYDSDAAQVLSDDINAADDIMIGLNWRINDNWLFAIEYHKIEGGAWLPPLNKTVIDPDYSNDWDLTAVQLSYKY